MNTKQASNAFLIGGLTLVSLPTAALADVEGLGFLSGSVDTNADGSEIYHNTGDVTIMDPTLSVFSSIETDQGFSQFQAATSIGTDTALIWISGSMFGESYVTFSLMLQIPETTTFNLSESYPEVFFEPSSPGSGEIDFVNGIISAGTYILSSDGEWYNKGNFDWSLELQGQFNPVPTPASVSLISLALLGGCRRRR